MRDIIEIDNVMNDTFDNHASAILNTIDEAVPNGISDIWVKLDSIAKSPNVCKRDDSKVRGIEVTKSVRIFGLCFIIFPKYLLGSYTNTIIIGLP